MQFKYFSNSPSQTKKLGELLAKKIIKDEQKKKVALVVALIGDLGGGKTTFLQGFAKGLGIREKVLSPTFILMRKFKTRTKTYLPAIRLRSRRWQAGNLKPRTFIHIDCYRIQSAREILDLGFKKATSDSKNIIAIEWADRIKKILPRDTMLVRFKFMDEKAREITIKMLNIQSSANDQTPITNEIPMPKFLK